VDWHDSYNMLIREKKGFLNSRLSQGDPFYKLFLRDSCLGKACYERCKFKYDQSSADIRIGDAWGSHYNDNEDGVSAAIAFTEKGNEILKSCNLTLEPLPFDVVAEGQMETNARKTSLRKRLLVSLTKEKVSMEDANRIIDVYAKYCRQLKRIKHPLRTIKNIFLRITHKK